MNRLGLLIPSSNVVLEPLAAQAQARDPNLRIHVSRLGVLDVKLDAASRAQFQLETQIAAAELLCDAKVDRIIWGGTSASWLGVAQDVAFVEGMKRVTSVPVTSCVLEINRSLGKIGAKRLGMVTPYTDDVADQINQNYADMGFEITAFRNDGGDMSHDFAAIKPAAIERMIQDVAAENVDGIVIMCTNVAGADVAERLEKELNVPILDSAAVSLKAF
ncbi:MAG: maleate isomerase [Reinekea sp.]|jgi:maleate isomerase